MARANRITSGADYRRVSRRGRRHTGRFTVISVAPAEGDVPRFGFILTRKVGGSVTRNKIRRRLKAVCYALVQNGMQPRDVVIRALPDSVSADWDSLRTEVAAAMRSAS